MTSPLASGLLAGIRLYQRAISPGLGAMCRFEPTCSRYAYQAIEAHGALADIESWVQGFDFPAMLAVFDPR